MVTAIVGGRIIDGTGRDPIAKGVVVVDNSAIRAVGSEGSVQIPRDAEVLDAGGKRFYPASLIVMSTALTETGTCAGISCTPRPTIFCAPP